VEKQRLLRSVRAYRQQAVNIQRAWRRFSNYRDAGVALLTRQWLLFENDLRMRYREQEGKRVFDKLRKRGLLSKATTMAEQRQKCVDEIPYDTVPPELRRRILYDDFNARKDAMRVELEHYEEAVFKRAQLARLGDAYAPNFAAPIGADGNNIIDEHHSAEHGAGNSDDDATDDDDDDTTAYMRFEKREAKKEAAAEAAAKAAAASAAAKAAANSEAKEAPAALSTVQDADGNVAHKTDEFGRNLPNTTGVDEVRAAHLQAVLADLPPVPPRPVFRVPLAPAKLYALLATGYAAMRKPSVPRKTRALIRRVAQSIIKTQVKLAKRRTAAMHNMYNGLQLRAAAAAKKKLLASSSSYNSSSSY
jgi:hypothetical protein